MTQESLKHIRPFNNDRMASFGAFRPSVPVVKPESPVEALPMANIAAAELPITNTMLDVPNMDFTSAAVAMEVSVQPNPAHITENQANSLVEQMQQEDILQAHNALDPERVARLLSLLD